MSLLLDHGHPYAWHYPIGMVYVEAQFVEKRLNAQEVTRALLLQMAVSSLLSKKGANQFAKYIKQLSE